MFTMVIGALFTFIIISFLMVDAPRYNKNMWVWALLGLFFNFLALGIYFIKIKSYVRGLIFIGLWLHFALNIKI